MADSSLILDINLSHGLHFHANYIEMIHQTTRWPPVRQETYGITVAGLNIWKVHDKSVIKRSFEVLENL